MTLRRGLAAGGLALVVLGIALATDGLRFEPRRDELHTWPTTLEFAARGTPDVELLRSYEMPYTPLFFILFGAIERTFVGGIAAARWVNLGLSCAILLFIGIPRRGERWRPLCCAAGLLAFPYYLGASFHLYTDILAAFFILAGVALHRGRWFWLSALFFALAIATRQFAVAIPLAVAAHALLSDGLRPRPAWIAPLAACATLLGWFALFGGLAPTGFVAHHETAEVWRVFPSYALYFLTSTGLYFAAVEWVVLAGQTPLRAWRTGRAAAIAGGLAALFVLFPPLGNVDYAIETMGFFDKTARTVMGDPARMVLFYVLALAACVRFSRGDLQTLLLLTCAGVTLKAPISWEKYVLPLLVVLWYQEARRLPGEWEPGDRAIGGSVR